MTPGTKTTISITVDNTKKTNLTLPITGGAGTVGLIALSMALAAGGAVVVVRNRRKEQEAA